MSPLVSPRSLFLIFASVLVLFCSLSAFARHWPESAVSGVGELPESVRFLSPDRSHSHDKDHAEKMDSVLAEFVEIFQRKGTVDFAAAEAKALRVSNDRVHVQVSFKEGPEAARKAVEMAGGEVTGATRIEWRRGICRFPQRWRISSMERRSAEWTVRQDTGPPAPRLFATWPRNPISNVDQDYDLYLFGWSGTNWVTVGSGTNYQNGKAGQTPRETAFALTSGEAAFYGFAILKYETDRNANLEIFAPKMASLDEAVNERSLANLADSPAAVTVAALDSTAPYARKEYSSQGPANGPGGSATGGFVKPDISAFANVSTESYGTGIFDGTSAATPHAAGAAALVLSAYPSYTPDQLESYLAGQGRRCRDAGHGQLVRLRPSAFGNPAARPDPYLCGDRREPGLGYPGQLERRNRSERILHCKTSRARRGNGRRSRDRTQ